MSGLDYPRDCRVRRRADFVRAFECGRRVGGELLTVWVIPNDQGATRFGVSVSRRHGSSVRRNRLKRILREAFRRLRPVLPSGLDVICAPRVGAELELTHCVEQLGPMIRRAARLDVDARRSPSL